MKLLLICLLLISVVSSTFVVYRYSPWTSFYRPYYRGYYGGYYGRRWYPSYGSYGHHVIHIG
ncbi:unnamed protein product [Chironomus riparius]|uniref:Uncharacterized protein n=1 Tax=Chironomus riparius TaxID=315576 RepID=A0A9N9RPB3_9DIPT|nr:unnamed protein product [Chironomus riparius]